MDLIKENLETSKAGADWAEVTGGARRRSKMLKSRGEFSVRTALYEAA